MKDNSPSSHGPEPASPRHIVREIEHLTRPLGDDRAPEAAIAVNTGLDYDGERLQELEELLELMKAYTELEQRGQRRTYPAP